MTTFDQTASKLKIMGHPVRLQILNMLRKGETCVCHIEQALNKRQSYISQQLMTLREAELVDSRKDGLQVYYWLIDGQIEQLLEVLIGSVEAEGLELVEGCNCPSCATQLITHIN